MPPTKGNFRKTPPRIPKLTDDLHNIEIYLRYSALRSEVWLQVLNLFEAIKTSVINDYNLETELRSTSSFRFPISPTLNISIIRTGNSVIIRFREGWKPSVKIKDSDITIGLPKKVALPGLILYAIFLGYDSYLDTQMKRLDLQLKKSELEEKLSTKKNLSSQGKSVDSAKKFVDYILAAPEMKFVRVNNFVIKK